MVEGAAEAIRTPRFRWDSLIMAVFLFHAVVTVQRNPTVVL